MIVAGWTSLARMERMDRLNGSVSVTRSGVADGSTASILVRRVLGAAGRFLRRTYRRWRTALGGHASGWAAVLAVLAVLLGAATSIVEKFGSPRWLSVALIVSGALMGAWVVVQPRLAVRTEQAQIMASRERRLRRLVAAARGVPPGSALRGWYFTGRTGHCKS